MPGVNGWFGALALVGCTLVGCKPEDGVGGGRDAGGGADAMTAEDARHDAGGAAGCGSATPIRRGEVLTGQSTALGGPPSTACRPSDAPQRFYAFELPAHYQARVTVTQESDARLVVRALAGCDATNCLTDAETSDAERAVTLVIDSPGDEPLTKIITVSTTSSRDVGTFRIALDLRAPLPPPVAETCDDATPLVPGALLRNEFVRGDGEPFGVCPAVGAPQHFYSLTIPGGQRGVVVVNPERGLVTSLINPVVRLLRACDATGCLDQDWMADRLGNHVANGYAAVGYDNRGGDAVTVLASVSNPASDVRADDQYAVRAVLEPVPATIPPNVRCDAAIPFAPFDAFVPFDSYAATEPGATCPGGIAEPGRLFYYTVEVPAGRALELTLAGHFALARLREACASAACITELANTDDNDDQRFTWRNTSGAPRTLVLALGARNALAITFNARLRLLP